MSLLHSSGQVSGLRRQPKVVAHRCWLLGSLILGLLFAGSARAGNLTGDVGVVSDYRYRGVSLSEENPAVQASLNLELPKGGYTGIWYSTIKDRGKVNSEFDVSAGDELKLASNVSLDLSATYYAYPSHPRDNYGEGTATLSMTRKALTGTIGVSAAPAQRAMHDDFGRRHDNVYVFSSAEAELPRLPVKVAATLGYERGAFDEVDHGGKWDWSLGGEAHVQSMKLGLCYVDSNASRGAIVGSIGLSF